MKHQQLRNAIVRRQPAQIKQLLNENPELSLHHVTATGMDVVNWLVRQDPIDLDLINWVLQLKTDNGLPLYNPQKINAKSANGFKHLLPAKNRDDVLQAIHSRLSDNNILLQSQSDQPDSAQNRQLTSQHDNGPLSSQSELTQWQHYINLKLSASEKSRISEHLLLSVTSSDNTGNHAATDGNPEWTTAVKRIKTELTRVLLDRSYLNDLEVTGLDVSPYDLLFDVWRQSCATKTVLAQSDIKLQRRIFEGLCHNQKLSRQILFSTDVNGLDTMFPCIVAELIDYGTATALDISRHRFSDKPNLADIDMRMSNLANQNLAHADLTGARLSEAYLYNANLSGADLKGADLQNANLQHANLDRADLRGARLAGANLKNASMKESRLDEYELFYLSRNHDIDNIQKLVNSGFKSIHDVIYEAGRHWTLLQAACMDNFPELAIWLVQQGANVTGNDRSGILALHLAIRARAPYTALSEILKATMQKVKNDQLSPDALWLDKNALATKLSYGQKYLDLIQDEVKLNPLHMLLLQYNPQNSNDKQREQQRLAIVRLMDSYQGRFNVQTRPANNFNTPQNDHKLTPDHTEPSTTNASGTTNSYNRVLQQSVNDADPDNNPILKFADKIDVQYLYKATIEYLYILANKDYKTRVSPRSNLKGAQIQSGDRPLHIAALTGDAQLIESITSDRMLSHSNSQNDHHITPLDKALQANNADTFNALLYYTNTELTPDHVFTALNQGKMELVASMLKVIHKTARQSNVFHQQHFNWQNCYKLFLATLAYLILKGHHYPDVIKEWVGLIQNSPVLTDNQKQVMLGQGYLLACAYQRTDMQSVFHQHLSKQLLPSICLDIINSSIHHKKPYILYCLLNTPEFDQPHLIRQLPLTDYVQDKGLRTVVLGYLQSISKAGPQSTSSAYVLDLNELATEASRHNIDPQQIDINDYVGPNALATVTVPNFQYLYNNNVFNEASMNQIVAYCMTHDRTAILQQLVTAGQFNALTGFNNTKILNQTVAFCVDDPDAKNSITFLDQLQARSDIDWLQPNGPSGHQRDLLTRLIYKLRWNIEHNTATDNCLQAIKTVVRSLSLTGQYQRMNQHTMEPRLAPLSLHQGITKNGTNDYRSVGLERKQTGKLKRDLADNVHSDNSSKKTALTKLHKIIMDLLSEAEQNHRYELLHVLFTREGSPSGKPFLNGLIELLSLYEFDTESSLYILQLVKHNSVVYYSNHYLDQTKETVIHALLKCNLETIVTDLLSTNLNHASQNSGYNIPAIALNHDPNGNNLLHYCAVYGNVHIINKMNKTLSEKLMNHDEAIKTWNEVNHHRETPLELAIKTCEQLTVKKSKNQLNNMINKIRDYLAGGQAQKMNDKRKATDVSEDERHSKSRKQASSYSEANQKNQLPGSASSQGYYSLFHRQNVGSSAEHANPPDRTNDASRQSDQTSGASMKR